MLKHYVEYLYPCIVLTKITVIQIPKRDVSKIDLPCDCVGFRFFDIDETEVDGKIILGQKKNFSCWYIEGEKMSLEQFKETFGNDPNYRNMIYLWKENGICAVAQNRFNCFVPLYAGDETI